MSKESGLEPAAETGTYDVCGVPIAAVTRRSAVDAVVAAAAGPTRLEVHLCNAYTLSLVRRDTQLMRALLEADLNLPDGSPAAWLGRKHGTSGAVRGPSLVTDVARAGVQFDVKHYLYGGAPEVAEEMARELCRRVPGLRIVGTESPPYHPLDEVELENLVRRIRNSGAGIVWIGLGTPRQDYIVPRLAAQLNVALVPVGAAFDFIAGRVSEAPSLLHGTGLEWIYRLSRDPRRLWRRYLIGNPQFVLNVVRSKMAKRSGHWSRETAESSSRRDESSSAREEHQE